MTLLYFRPFFFSFGDYLVFMLPSISLKRDLTTFFSISLRSGFERSGHKSKERRQTMIC